MDGGGDGDGDDGNGIWCLRGRRAAAAEAAARTNSVFLFGKLAVLSREMIQEEGSSGKEVSQSAIIGSSRKGHPVAGRDRPTAPSSSEVVKY